MKITAAPSPRGTNNERLFFLHCPRGSTPELARPHHGRGGPASYCRRSRPDANIENDVVTPYAGLIDESAARRSFYFCCVPVTVETFSDFRSRRSIGVSGALQPFCASYGTHGKTADHTFPNRCPVLTGRNNGQTRRIRPCGSDRCLCSGKDRPQSGRCAAGPFRCSTQPAPSASARSTAGCRIVPTRTLATVPSIPLVGIRRPGSLRRRLPSQSPRCWTRSVTHARSARLRIEAKVAATSLLPPVQSAHGPTRSGTGREQGVCRWRV